MSGGKVHIPPVYKRLLSLRWFRPHVENESTATNREWKTFKHGNIFQQKQDVSEDRHGGLTKEQINFLVFRAGRGTAEGIFRETQNGAFFPDIAPRIESFKEDELRQIRCMLSQSYRSYKVDRASVWKMLYFSELLMKGYTLQRLVSRGDFGVVYSAAFNGANSKARVSEEIAKDGAELVGIKIIDKSDTHWYQVRNEIATHASTSDHPNVLKLYQVFHTATATYLVQEFADRGSLESVVPRKGFTEEECRILMKGVLHGLRHLHRLDVVHRNLTCANILLTSQGTVKIAEFGLACVLPDRDFLLHQKVGTSGYMAPEILRGQRYNGFLADIWTIGIVLYFLLHKFLPFTDEDLTLHNCWRCLDFTYRSLSVELCLLLRSVLQFRPTQRPSVEGILRHDWFAKDEKPRVKSQAKQSTPPKPSVQPEQLPDRPRDLQRSASVQSVQEEPLLKRDPLQKRDLGRCWANLMHSDGLNNERITLRSRLISHSQQDKINRLESKLKARSRNKTQRKAPSSLNKDVPRELGSTKSAINELSGVGNGETGAPTKVPPGQAPTAPLLPTLPDNQPPTADVEPESGDGRGKGVYCTAMKCVRQTQQERMLFETPSNSLKSSLTIHIASVSEDDEDNYDRDRKEEQKESDKEPDAKRHEEDRTDKKTDIQDKDDGRNVMEETNESVKKMNQEMMITGTGHSGERRSLTVETSRGSDEDPLNSERRLSGDRHSPRPHKKKRDSAASSHQAKEESSERRLIASIQALTNSSSNIDTIPSARFPSRSSEDDEGSLARLSRFGGTYAAQPSLEALDEVPAEYAAGLDVEDEEIERLIRTQYYNQMDLPSTADFPLEAEQHEFDGAPMLNESSKSWLTVATRYGSLGSVAEDAMGESHEGTPPPPPYETAGGLKVKMLFAGSPMADNTPCQFLPELAINWEMIASTIPDCADIAGQKEIKKSRTTMVSKAPSLKAITEEHPGGGRGAGAGAGVVGGIPEKTQAQDNLRKTDSFGKRVAEGFPSKTKSKDVLLSSSTSSVGRLLTQSQHQIQEERSESAVWESISYRGIPRGSYPKLAASFACETSLHSIVESAVEKDAEHLENQNQS